MEIRGVGGVDMSSGLCLSKEEALLDLKIDTLPALFDHTEAFTFVSTPFLALAPTPPLSPFHKNIPMRQPPPPAPTPRLLQSNLRRQKIQSFKTSYVTFAKPARVSWPDLYSALQSLRPVPGADESWCR